MNHVAKEKVKLLNRVKRYPRVAAAEELVDIVHQYLKK